MNKSSFTLGISAGRLQRFRTTLDACENVANHFAGMLTGLRSGLNLRRATSRDNESISDFLNHIFLYKGHLASEALRSDQELADINQAYQDRDAFFGVMTNQNDIVGTVGIKRFDSYSCELKKLHLCPEFTNQENAKKMLDFALDRARALNYEQCIVRMLPGEPEIQNFLLMNGFNPTCRAVELSGNFLCRPLR